MKIVLKNTFTKINKSAVYYFTVLGFLCLLIYLANIFFIDWQFKFYYWLVDLGFEEYKTDFVTSTLRLTAYDIFRIAIVLLGLKLYNLLPYEIGWRKSVSYKKIVFSILLVPLYMVFIGLIMSIIKHGALPVYSIQLSNGWNNLHNPVIWFYLCIIILFTFLEEIFYRGFLQTALEKKIGAKYAILLTSVFFALMHTEVSSNLFQHFLAGIFLGSLKKWDKSLWSCSLAHLFINILSAWFLINYH
jgi:membrane protease YdiL (CAAX protease family)